MTKQLSKNTFSSHNPATGDLLWQGPEASSADVDEAVQNARRSFASWSALSLDERSSYLAAFADVLRKREKAFAETIAKETGKPLWDANGEVHAMINKVALSLESYGSRCAGMIHDLPHGRSITRHRPHGPVAVLGPYNFPGHLPNGHIVPALLAGNTVVFKPSELTPLTGEMMIQCWQDAGLPKGVLNIVQGGRTTGQALITHPDIQGIFFTGSYQTGLYLSEMYGSHPGKILALEMGGNNPLIVGTIQDPDAASYLTIQSAYLSSGQRCTCARRLIIIQDANTETFVKKLIAMIQKISVGPYTQVPEPFMGPVISETHAKKLIEAKDKLIALGGRTLVDMKILKPATPFVSPGLMDVTSIKDRPDEEIFGPFLQLIYVKTLDDALAEANRTQYGLSAGLLSDNPNEYNFFLSQIKAGIVNWNAPLTGATSSAPFGGVKCSGNHRPSAFYAADYCSYPVASIENPDLKMPSKITPGIKP